MIPADTKNERRINLCNMVMHSALPLNQELRHEGDRWTYACLEYYIPVTRSFTKRMHKEDLLGKPKGYTAKKRWVCT